MKKSRLGDWLTEEEKAIYKNWHKEVTLKMAEVVEIANRDGKTIAEVVGYTSAHLDHMYIEIKGLYENGQYEEAVKGFRSLALLDHRNPRYTFSLAASLHKLKEYARAALVYAKTCDMDPERADVYYHAADCYMRLNRVPMAYFYLKEAISVSRDKKKYALVKARCQHTLEALKNLESEGKLEKDQEDFLENE